MREPEKVTLENGVTIQRMHKVSISHDAYRALCGLVQDSEDVSSEAVFAYPATWDELRATFPIADARLTCTNCGETYREGDHVIEDRDPGLCLTCAVGG